MGQKPLISDVLNARTSNWPVKMRCPGCSKSSAIIDPVFGPTECLSCRKKKTRVKLSTELTTDDIRDQRQEYRNDILQPFVDGVLSKEYMEEYGTQGIAPTMDEVKNARYVSRDMPGWWNRHKSKGGKRK